MGDRRSDRAAATPPGAPRAAGGPEPGPAGVRRVDGAARQAGRRPPGAARARRSPGVVLVFDYLAGSLWRYRARRAGALVHSFLALLLAVPYVALHRRGLPRLTAATAVKTVTPGADAVRTAAWARSELAVRLGHRPDLDGWTVTVSSFYVLLNRPADRVPEMGNGVGAGGRRAPDAHPHGDRAARRPHPPRGGVPRRRHERRVPPGLRQQRDATGEAPCPGPSRVDTLRSACRAATRTCLPNTDAWSTAPVPAADRGLSTNPGPARPLRARRRRHRGVGGGHRLAPHGAGAVLGWQAGAPRVGGL
jgi:hypothetical protein